MYKTPGGERILQGAERQLFQQSLGMMVDLLSDGDIDFDVFTFDQLQRGQKIATLYQAGRALLYPTELAPELTACIEAAAATVFRFALNQIEQEITDPELLESQTFWRALALRAASQQNAIVDLPSENCSDLSAWQLVIESLEGDVLWDNDFEMQIGMDVAPETGKDMKQKLGISDDYYVAIPPDIADAQINLYLDALKGLTPAGRA